MSEVVKFTKEELESIEVVQQKYSDIGMRLVQLRLATKQSNNYLQALKEEEDKIDSEIVENNTNEKELATKLNEKYGVGALDMTTGEFTTEK
tara:strand:- start:353 stop:628 length:276 start_codon:yes stop_codon:yes gene_type:complete